MFLALSRPVTPRSVAGPLRSGPAGPIRLTTAAARLTRPIRPRKLPDGCALIPLANAVVLILPTPVGSASASPILTLADKAPHRPWEARRRERAFLNPEWL
jgi:hypothetical protein